MTAHPPASFSRGRPSSWIDLLLTVWSVLFLWLCVRSLQWPVVHDTPLLHYVAWRIQQGERPYLDIFEMNLPGTYAIHLGILSVFGDSLEALRRADLVWLGLTLLGAGWVLRRWGRASAWTGGLLLGTLYLLGGPFDTLQRDYLLLLPLLLALGCATQLRRLDVGATLAGIALGCCVLIKPTMALVLPILWGTLVFRGWNALEPRMPRVSMATSIRVGGILVAGFLIPLALAWAWLTGQGSLDALLWTWADYLLPLYGHLDGNGHEWPSESFVTLESAREAFRTILTPGRGALTLAAVAGLLVAWRRTRDHALLRMDLCIWSSLGLVGFLHVIFSVKQWWYHWWPAYTALALLATPLVLAAHPARSGGTVSARRWPSCMRSLRSAVLPVWGIAVSIVAHMEPPHLARAQIQADLATRLSARIMEITSPDDRVQILDTVGGGVLACFLARRAPGSRFLYDFHFFHHAEHPTTQALRRMLVEDLELKQPRVIVLFARSWSHREHYASLQAFPELTRLMSQHYVLLDELPEYRLFRRKEHP